MPAAVLGPVIGAGISGAAGLAGSAMQSGAAGKAAGQATHNLQLELPQFQANYNAANALYQPYANVGPGAVEAQQDLLGLNGPDAAAAAMANFQTSPGYQWTVQQALRGVDAGAASREMLRSGATIKAEQDRAADLANQEFGNYFSRLGTMANTGFQGAGGIVTAGNNLQNAITGNVSAQNAATIGGANAQSSIFGNAASGLSSTVNSLFSNPNFQQWISGNGATGPSSLNASNPTIAYGGTTYGAGGQSFPSFNPFGSSSV